MDLILEEISRYFSGFPLKRVSLRPTPQKPLWFISNIWLLDNLPVELYLLLFACFDTRQTFFTLFNVYHKKGLDQELFLTFWYDLKYQGRKMMYYEHYVSIEIIFNKPQNTYYCYLFSMHWPKNSSAKLFCWLWYFFFFFSTVSRLGLDRCN